MTPFLTRNALAAIRSDERFLAGNVHKLLHYDPGTGLLTYRADAPDEMFDCPRAAKNWRARCGGKVAGRKRARCVEVNLLLRRWKAHRLIWMIAYRQSPPPIVDHINGDPFDNRLANLRSSDTKGNARNRRRHRDGASRFKGVYPLDSGRWLAKIYPNGATRRLGVFETQEEAAAAYDAAARVEFGEFARLNFPAKEAA